MTSRQDHTTEPAHRKAARSATRRRHRAPRRSLLVAVGLLCGALGVPAAIAATTGFRALAGNQKVSTQGPRNLVYNGDFEVGLLGWRTNHQKQQVLSRSPIAADGDAGADRSDHP